MILKEKREEFSDGVVYLYKGSIKEIKPLIEMDLYLAVNLCTIADLKGKELVKKIPLNRLIVETNFPFIEDKT